MSKATKHLVMLEFWEGNVFFTPKAQKSWMQRVHC